MFKGRLTQTPSQASRAERRLAVLAGRRVPGGGNNSDNSDSNLSVNHNGNRTNDTQRLTRRNAEQQLRRLEAAREGRTKGRRPMPPPYSSASVGRPSTAEFAESMADVQRAQGESLREEDARRIRGGGVSAEDRMWGAAAAAAAERQQQHQRPPRYDDQDAATGDSVVQLRFDALAHAAVLRFGPPLPPEFVAENDVVTSSTASPLHTASSSSSSFSGAGGGAPSWREDLGADGSSFMMYDEVGLKPHELLTAIRRVKPDFSLKVDGDGVPFSLLVQNCSYFRAFGGRVNYMRYLKRERLGPKGSGGSRIVVSIAKYKMRESASRDGVRQGPQPWKHSYGMV